MANAVSTNLNMPQQLDPKSRPASQENKKVDYKSTVDTGKKSGDIIGNAGQILGKNEFLKLLVTQLSKQNPLNPVNDREFIAQMAQFSALEQMQNVSSGMSNVTNELKNFKENNIRTMQNIESYSLLGKKVYGFDFKDQQQVEGIVKSVYRDKGGEIFVKVENNEQTHDIKFSSINKAEYVEPVSRETYQPATQTKAEENYGNNQQANTTKGEQIQ